MRETINKVAILDCIGFDLAQSARPMQVRFAKCLVHDNGRVERQWQNDRLLCHRVTIERGEDIDARMEMECRNLEAMGYDPPTPRMIARIKAHCSIEWDGEVVDLPLLLPAPEAGQIPFSIKASAFLYDLSL